MTLFVLALRRSLESTRRSIEPKRASSAMSRGNTCGSLQQ
jgi:hypothetical protein